MSAVEDAQYSVVRVFCFPSQSSFFSTGTGFAVGELSSNATIFVTNNHVVQDDLDNVYVSITDIHTLIKAKVLFRDETQDIAIIQIDIPLTDRKPIVLKSPTQLHKSEDIYCIGFPGAADDFSDRGAEFSSTIEDLTIT